MSASLVKMGKTKFRILNTVATFTPVGDIVEVGDSSEWYSRHHRLNPIKRRDSKPSQGGRIILGFNVGIEEKVKMEDVVNLVFALRKKQVNAAIKDGDAQPHPLGGDIGATLLAQAGLWQGRDDPQAYPENGVQVVIMNVVNETPARFDQDMIDIAEEFVAKFQQQAVIVELMKRGTVEETIEVGP